MRMNWKKSLVLIFGCGAFSLFMIFYLCGDGFCGESHVVRNTIVPELLSPISDSLSEYRNGRLSYNNFSQDTISESRHVNINKEDVIVFLHIQKTGGTTFGRHLVKDLKLKSPCKCYKDRKRCDCYTNKKTIWLFSRYSTGWVCGLHADWTELTSCVETAMDKKEKKTRYRKYVMCLCVCFLGMTIDTKYTITIIHINGPLPISRVAPLHWLLPLSLGSSG